MFFFSLVNATNHHSSSHPFAGIKRSHFLPAESVEHFSKILLFSPNLEPDFCTFRILSGKGPTFLAVELSSRAAYLG